MTSGPMPICSSCARFTHCGDGFGFCCEAFPDGIPEAIVRDGADHRKPFKGDRGIRFVLSEEAGAADRLAAYEATQA